MNDKRIRRAGRALERLVLGLTGVYLALCALERTTFYLPVPPWFQKLLLAALALLALARLPFVGLKRKEPWIGAALGAVYFMVYRADRYIFLPFMAVLTVALIDIDYRRILRVWVFATGGVLAAAVVAALAGGIENFVYYRDGLRSSWGICYPTDLSSWVLFLVVMLWAAWDGLPDWAAMALCVPSALLALRITQSRNSLACSALLFLAIAYHAFEGRFAIRAGRLKWMRRACDALLTAAFAAFAALSILMVAFYARGTAAGEGLNAFMSNRLQQAWLSYQEYGLTAFGSPLPQIGAGFSVFPQASERFVDSSYVLMLLRYGWVYLLAVCALWTWTVRRALRGGHRRLALAMGVIAFHSIMEHHFTEVNYNILVAMPLAAFAAAPDGGRRRRAFAAGGMARSAFAALLCLAAWFGLPALLTRLRTVFQALLWQGGGQSAMPVLAVLLGVAAALIGAVWALWRIAGAAVRRRRPGKAAACALAACVALGAGAYLWSDGVVSAAERESAALLEAEAPMLEPALSAAAGGVYAEILPEVYMRRFEGFRASALWGDDLSRLRGSTVLLEAGTEHPVFFLNGFHYAQISGVHALYTDDAAVARALAEAGCAVTDYFSAILQPDLGLEARLNALEVEERGVLLDGPGHSLAGGAYVDLYEGSYEARFTLRLDAAQAPAVAEARVCRLRVRASWGQDVLAEQPVYLSQFDAEGSLTVAVPFSTAAAQGVDFQAIADEGWRLYVSDLCYYKLPGQAANPSP